MIGKRRFIVILTALGVCAALEITGRIAGTEGLSPVARDALIGVVGLYMGSKFLEKPENGGK